MPSFTIQVPNLVQMGPVVELKIIQPSALKSVSETPVAIHAMVDTGATGTVVKQEIVEKLGLNPVGTVTVNTPSSTGVVCYQYPLRLQFPNNVMVETVVIGAPLKEQHIECLVGRDILGHGVFVYTGYINQFTSSF